MKESWLYFLIKDIKEHIKLYKFKAEWRSKNDNNQTEAMNIFPIDKVKIGDYTYGKISCYFFGSRDSIEYIKIGNCVSIAEGTIFVAGGEHDYKSLSLFPFKQRYYDSNFYEAISKGPIVIEDDCWIGKNAIIMSGVTIGKGSVIGAGAIVTSDIPAYSIAVGSPAKVIKKRFNDDICNKLSNVNFNNISLDFIIENYELFEKKCDNDVLDNFINKIPK